MYVYFCQPQISNYSHTLHHLCGNTCLISSHLIALQHYSTAWLLPPRRPLRFCPELGACRGFAATYCISRHISRVRVTTLWLRHATAQRRPAAPATFRTAPQILQVSARILKACGRRHRVSLRFRPQTRLLRETTLFCATCFTRELCASYFTSLRLWHISYSVLSSFSVSKLLSRKSWARHFCNWRLNLFVIMAIALTVFWWALYIRNTIGWNTNMLNVSFWGLEYLDMKSNVLEGKNLY